ncbi:MAG: hypothetical protein M3454_03330 [Actinomycetota bacterium]|nr:hypothetical protein [Actinomycetota bacterium]
MPEQRNEGTKIDLEKLEDHARSLYLNRFVEAIQQARGEHGRYLSLRAGDELAIRAAADGSSEWLQRILVLDEESSPKEGAG